MLNEKELERACCRLAERNGWTALKLVSPNRQGVPDRMFMWFNGHIKFVEFKTAKGKLSPVQERTIQQFARHGHKVHVIRGIEEFVRCLGLEQ